MKEHLKEQVEHHQREIEHHEEAIRRHRQAMKEHKKGMEKLDEDSDWDRGCYDCVLLWFCVVLIFLSLCDAPIQKHVLQTLLMDVNVFSKFDWSLK